MPLHPTVQAAQQGFQIGFDSSLRLQQLRSQQALRRLQEQQAAEQLRWTIYQHNEAIQEQADNAKKANAFMARITPEMPLPEGYVGPPVANPAFQPDIGKAYIESFLPGARDPTKVLLDAATIQLRQAQAMDEMAQAALRGQATPRAPSLVGVDVERQKLLQAQQNLTQTRIDTLKQGQGYAPTDTQKNLRALAEAELNADYNAIAALRKQLKLDGLSELDTIKFRSELRELDSNPLTPVAEKEQRRELIYQKYDAMAQGKREEEMVPVIDPQGRRGRVPRRNLEKALQQGYKVP